MKSILLVSLLAFLGTAHARVTASKDLTLLQQGCTNPESVNNQNPPSEINISCAGSEEGWDMVVTNPQDLAQSATVTSSATTDKPNVNAAESASTGALPPTKVGCPVWTKVNMTAAATFMVTCEQVMAMTNLNTWCAEKLVGEATVNPLIWTGTTAGEVYNPCTMTAPEPTPPGEAYPAHPIAYPPDFATQLPAPTPAPLPAPTGHHFY